MISAGAGRRAGAGAPLSKGVKRARGMVMSRFRQAVPIKPAPLSPLLSLSQLAS